MSMSLEAAAQVMREAMRETVKRHSLWYLIQGGLMIVAGILALVFPAISSVAVVVFLGWLLIVSGILQAISLIGARHVPHFWLQLVSVVLFIIVGSLFLRNPGEGLLTLTLLLIVFFMTQAERPTRAEPAAKVMRKMRGTGTPISCAASPSCTVARIALPR